MEPLLLRSGSLDPWEHMEGDGHGHSHSPTAGAWACTRKHLPGSLPFSPSSSWIIHEEPLPCEYFP